MKHIKKRSSSLLALMTCPIYLASAVMSTAAAQDVFNSNNGGGSPTLKGSASIDCYEGWAACNAWNHYHKASAPFQGRAKPCLNHLKDALEIESEMVPVNQRIRQARGHGVAQLNDKFRQLNEEREERLAAYRECIRTGTTRPIQEAACSPLTKNMRDRLLEARNALDNAGKGALAAGNSFFGGMVDEVKGSIDGLISGAEFLAQPPGEPARQIREVIVKYLTDESGRHDVNQALYKAAVNAVEEAKRDPGRAAGRLAVNLVPLPACKFGKAAKMANVAEDVAGLEKAAENLAATAKAAENFAATIPPSGSQQALAKIVQANPTGKNMPPVNPWGGNRNCYTCVKKSIDNWRWQERGLPYPPVAAPVAGVTRDQITRDLRATYGHLPPPANLPDWAVNQWRQGVPFKVTSVDDLIAKASHLGDGTTGFVFLDRWNPVLRSNEAHAIKIDVRNGRVHVSDPQNGLPDVRSYFADPFLTEMHYYPVNYPQP